MSGIGRNTIEHSSSVTNDDLVNEFLVRRDEVPPSAKVERVSSNVCDCVWSNNECAKCAHYDCFKCSFCPMVFIYAGVRNRHLRMSHKNELVNQCGDLFLQNFIGRPAAENENDSLDDVVQYYCAECSDAFQNKVDLIGHLREHSLQMKCTLAKSSQNQRLSNGSVRRRSRSQYQCEHCSKVVSTKEGIKKHLSISHPCGTRVSFNQTVRKRSSKSTPGVKRNESDQVDAGALKNGYYTCDICGQIFLKRHSFTRHVNKHSSNRYNCDKCKKSFASETTLSTHQLRKHKELPKNVFFLNGRKYLKCNQCSFTCRNERNKLEEHMRVHTGEKPFTCELCGKQFRTKALLRVHNRYVHEGIKEHGCDICGRCFSNKRYMEEHRRIHTGEKPLICDLCGKTFRQNSSLSKHIENHLGIKKHACSLCDRRFSNSHHLSIHIKRHLGEASHKCEHCDKKFVDQYQLKNHKVVHSEARPFVCKLCGNGFKLRKHLKQHGRTHRS